MESKSEVSMIMYYACVKVFRIIPEFRMLNSACSTSFSDLISVYLKVFDPWDLTLKLGFFVYFVVKLQV